MKENLDNILLSCLSETGYEIVCIYIFICREGAPLSEHQENSHDKWQMVSQISVLAGNNMFIFLRLPVT